MTEAEFLAILEREWHDDVLADAERERAYYVKEYTGTATAKVLPRSRRLTRLDFYEATQAFFRGLGL